MVLGQNLGGPHNLFPIVYSYLNRLEPVQHITPDAIMF